MMTDLKGRLLGKKELPVETPELTINTLIESTRTHSPDLGSRGSLAQGQITTRNSLGYVLQNVRAQGALTSTEWDFLTKNRDAICSNSAIRAYIDRLNPWDGYTWEKLFYIVDRVAAQRSQSSNEPKITQVRAQALEKYTGQPQIPAGEPSKLDHSQTQKAVKDQADFRAKTGSSDLLVIPPKHRAPDGQGGSSEFYKSEMSEHARFSKQHEERLTRFYEALGVNDLRLDCVHLMSRDSIQAKDCIANLRETVICNLCGKTTPRAKLMEQIKP